VRYGGDATFGALITRAILVLGALAWLLGGLGAALAHVRHDALGSLGVEAQAAAAVLCAGHVLLGGPLLLIGRALLRSERLPVRGSGVLVTLAPPAIALATIALPGLQTAPAPPDDLGHARASGPTIVLITLDTFRADHLDPEHTPALLGLAAEGCHYRQAVTPVPLTAPAHASMLTGLDVADHGLRANGMSIEPEVSVVPRLAAAGYRTGAFLGAHVLDRTTGLSAGFQHYDDRWGARQRHAWSPALPLLLGKGRPVARRGDEVVERALRWIGAEDRPAFLWIHLYDAHAPYRPPASFRPDEAALADARRRDNLEWDAKARGMGLFEMVERGRVESQKLLYRAETRWVDELVSQVLTAVGPEAVVVVAADHGESLDEHEYYFNHGARLWEPSLHVPLIVRWPGELSAGCTENGLVSIAQVGPLLLAAAGLDDGATPGPVREVWVSTTGQQARQIGMFTHLGKAPEQRRGNRQGAALRLDGAKLLSHDGAEPVYHDLHLDPEELVAAPVPEALQAAGDLVEERVSVPPPTLDQDQLERLRALGYVP